MARSPSDATRFTATGPYISTKPSFGSNPTSFSSNPSTTTNATSSTNLNFSAPGPANETAQQKIARLRHAAALARQSKESSFDRTVRVGRTWADRAHRVTALGLIGLTLISGVVATAGITDMLLHNRRRRNEWLAQKQAESAQQLAVARQALQEGRVTEDQMLLINRERAKAEAEEAKQRQPGVFKRATSWLYSGVEKEETKGGRFGVETATQGTQLGSSISSSSPPGHSVIQAAEENLSLHRSEAESIGKMVRPAEGPLDQQAQNSLDAISQTAKSWTSWVTGR